MNNFQINLIFKLRFMIQTIVTLRNNNESLTCSKHPINIHAKFNKEYFLQIQLIILYRFKIIL